MAAVTGPRQGEYTAEEETIDGLRFFRTAPVKAAPPPFGELREIGKFARRIHQVARGFEPDLLHAHSPVLDAIARSNGRCKGISVVPLDIATSDLVALKAKGIVGIAFNSTLDGVDYYLRSHDLLARLADLDMILQIQAEKDQLADFHPLLDKTKVKLAIDHCGRPDIAAGLQAPGFQALLDLGRSGRACVKLSGYAKFSRRSHPYDDVQPFVGALLDAFTPDACVVLTR